MPSNLEDLLRQTEAVRHLARRLVLDDDQTDDVLQEARLAALARPPPEGVPLRAWLAGIVKNLAARRRREDTRRRHRETRRVLQPVPREPHEVLGRAETHRMLVEAVLSLEEPYRTTILLRFFDGLPPREITLQTGVPVATVSTHIHRGLAQLRVQLDETHGGARTAWRAALLPVATGSTHILTGGTQSLAVGTTLMSHKTLGLGVLALLLLAFFVPRLLGSGDQAHAPDGAGRLLTAERADGQRPELAGRDMPGASIGPVSADLPAPVDLALVDRNRDLHGVVVAASSGAPVSGAHLQVVFYPWRPGGFVARGAHYEERLGAETLSARDGTFRLRLRRGEEVGLRVDAPGFARVELRKLQAGGRVTVSLTRGLTLRVRVTDESGAALPGTRVRMFGLDHREIQRTEVTAEDGTAVFDRLIRDLEVTLDAKHPDHGDSGWTRYRLPSAASAQTSLVLPAGRVLTGRVTCAETGDPIAGARIGMGWTSTNEVRSDADGRYRLPGWTGGRISLIARAQGHGVKAARLGELDVVDFALPRGATVRGRVVDANGAPVEGAYVGALSVQNLATGRATSQRVGRTDAAGRFELDSIRADLDLRVVAFATGRGRYAERFASARLADLALDLGDVPLTGSRSVTGVVVDDQGEPVARLPVWILLLPSGGHKSRPQQVFGRGAGLSTDDLGRFHFRGLLTGDHLLWVRAPGQSDIKQAVTVPQDADVTDLRIVIPGTRTLRVGVHTPDGRPIPTATVYVSGRGNYHTSGTPGDDGFAALEVRSDADQVGVGLSAETYSRYVGNTNSILAPGEEEVHFVLQEAVPTRGTVIGPDEKPMGRLQVIVEVAGKQVAMRTSDNEGLFEVPIPVGSRADVVITGWATRQLPGGATQGFRGPHRGRLVGVRPGETDLVLRIRKPGGNRTLRIQVLLPSGAPAARAQIRIDPPPARGSASVTADAEGRVELKGLSAQPARVSAWYHGGDLPDNVGAEAEDVVPDGQEITLRVRAGLLLKGVVADETGGPLDGVTVRILGARKNRRIVGQSGADGTWQVRLAPEDGAQVGISAAFTLPDGKQVVGLLQDVPVDTTVVRLVLRPVAK